MVAYDDLQMDHMGNNGDEEEVGTFVKLMGGGDMCHFLFKQTTTLKRWQAWGTLVWQSGRAWRRFVSGTPDGHEAARRVFSQFPTPPDDYLLRQAWRETRAAMPSILMEAL